MTLRSFFDRVFVINLRRRPDRRAQCEDELLSNGIDPHDTSFVEWVDGFDHPTSGHKGCTRSHRELIRRIASGPWKQVLVFEDDWALISYDDLMDAGFGHNPEVMATFHSVLDGRGGLVERFEALAPYVPRDWDVLYLGGGYGEAPIRRMNRHVIQCGFIKTTSSYGITRKFAKTWDEKVNAMARSKDVRRHPGPIDEVFGSLAKEHQFYIFQPRLTFQRASTSDICGETNSYLNSMTDPVHERMV